MKSKLNVGVIFGGRSGEHEISILSAREVMAALDPTQYNVIPIYISRNGQWFLSEQPTENYQVNCRQATTLLPDPTIKTMPTETIALSALQKSQKMTGLDVVFPVLHGSFGEDGTIQGLLEMAGVAYVGSGVLGSAVGMDKVVMKAVFQQAGLPITAYRTVYRPIFDADPRKIQSLCEKAFPYPWFVKPANLGSSIGIHKVKKPEEFIAAMNDAFQYDRKVLVEQGVDARDLEIAVLGNDELSVTDPAEIITTHEFYSYDAKYADASVRLDVPAKIPANVAEKMKEAAKMAFQAVDAAGMGRVDFLVRRSDLAFFVSEINTIPGFTRVSMYPRMWQAAGLSYPELLNRLIQLAMARHEQKQSLKTEYQGAISFDNR